MERQGKMEIAAKERERQRLESIPKKWNRREEYEFLRVLTGYGIDLQQSMNILAPDWIKFKAMAHLERKSDETLSDYYKVFIAMCKRQAGVKLTEGERGLEGIIEDISEDHAKLILDRLELLSKLREVARHPMLDERLKICQNNVDTPDWWDPGRHDKELVSAVLKHGLYRSETFIFNDPTFSFLESEKRFLRELEAQIQRFKMEPPFVKDEIIDLDAVVLVKEEPKTESVASVKAEALDADVKPKVEEPVETVAIKEDLNKSSGDSEHEKAAEDEIEDLSASGSHQAAEKSVDSEPAPVAKVESEPFLAEEETASDLSSRGGELNDSDMKDSELRGELQKPIRDQREAAEEPEKMDTEDLTEVKEKSEERAAEKVDPEQQEASEETLAEDLASKEEEPATKKETENGETLDDKENASESKETVPVPHASPAEKPVDCTDLTTKKTDDVLDLASSAASGDPDDDEVMKEKEKAVEEECKKQAAELKARFPDLEVIQPSVKHKSDKERPKLEKCMVRWFKDFALEKRISHVITCVEKNQWPVNSNYSAYAGCQGVDLDIALHETIAHLNMIDRRSETPDVITITTDQGMPKHLQAQLQASQMPTNTGPTHAQMMSSVPSGSPSSVNTSGGGKKRKRHIAIDVETERAKLHALLNSSQTMGQKAWGEEDSNDSRRSSSSLSLQPPPAHQHPPRQSSAPFNKPAVPPMKTPPPQMGGPMDLSSSLPKMSMSDMLKASPIDLSEVQDFSMGNKKTMAAMSSAYASSALGVVGGGVGGGNKGKLDDTLSKLMKKNNCTIEEPVVGKEKKRKKLDEIVLGLSAAKEQKTFPDPSLPSSKKQPITPSVSVTPANVPSTMASQSNQKPFTITVTSVPGKSKGGSSSMPPASPSSSHSSSSGLAALQNMAMGGVPSKDSLNALLAQTMQADPQTFLKQQQKMMQCLPASQRKAYEVMLADMKQAVEMSSKYNSHDVKVNKWLAEQNAALNEQLNMDYRRSSRSSSGQTSMPKASPQQPPPQPPQQQQQQQQPTGPQSLTGDEPVPVINKQTGKRLTGNKAPQLKRLMQWLTDNPTYEVDPKWLEHMQNPMAAPSPKPNPMDTSSFGGGGGGNSSKNHGGRPSSTSSNASASSHSQQQQQQQSQSKKSSRQSAIDQANAMQFGGLAGLNPNLLSGLPGLGGFDPKNPLLMPFAGMPGLGSMSGLGNLNNMNLFANLAGLGGLGNLAGMDAQSLAALMAAAGTGLGGLGGATAPSGGGGGGGKASSQSSKKSKNNDNSQQNSGSSQGGAGQGGSGGGGGSKNIPTSSASSSAGNNAFPFLFPNPGLLYPPLGLGGLNPYSLGSGLSAYDQLAQQYNLLNGANNPPTSSSSTSKSSHQSQSKSSNSRSNAMSTANMGASTSTSSSGRGRSSASSRAAANEMAQLSSLLMGNADPHLLESLSRMAGMDLGQASRLMSSLGGQPNPPSDKRSSASSAMSSKEAQEKQAAKEQQKWMESLARGAMPPDLATLQAFTQGKLPSSSQTSSSSKGGSKSSSSSQLPQMSMAGDLSQAFLAEMAAQAMAAAAGSGPLSMGGAGGGSGSGMGGGGGGSSKRSRDQEMKDAFEQFSKQQMDLYTRTLGLGSGISLIPTSSSGSSGHNDDHKSKRSRSDSHTSSSSKDDLSAGLPLNLGSMSNIEKSLRGMSGGGGGVGSSSVGGRGGDGMGVGLSGCDPIDKVTFTPLSSAGIAANLPSQTTITIAPPISSGASTSSDRSERSESRISLTITNAADAAKLPPPYEEADELIIQPILKKVPPGAENDEAYNEERRSSSRLKRPRSSADHSLDTPPEKRRELRSTRHTRQSGGSETLNLSTSSENDTDKGDQ